MKLIPYNDDVNDEKIMLENYLQQTDPTVNKISILDHQMKSILNSDLDEDSKLKLYQQTLNKLLTVKNLLTPSENTVKLLTPNIKTPQKLSILNTPKNLLSSTPTQNVSIYSTPSSRSIIKKKNTPKISSAKVRKVKKQAIRRIKEFYKNSETESEEDEWKRYNPPKTFKRLKK